MNQKIRILIADDDHLIRRWLRLFIDQTHDELEKIVYEAEDGQQAIEMIREHELDLVISDLKMPYRNGLEVVEFVQKHYPSISTIVLSAYNELDDVKNALKLGAKDYILKAEMQTEDISRMITHTLEFKNKWHSDQAKIDFVKHDIALWQYFLKQSGTSSPQAQAFQVLYDSFPNQVFAIFFSLRPCEMSEGLPLFTDTALTLSIQAKLSEQEWRTIVLPIENNSFLVLYSVEDRILVKNGLSEIVMRSFQKATQEILADYDLEVTAVLTQIFLDLAEFRDGYYRSLRKFLHIRYYAGYEKDMYQDKLSIFSKPILQKVDDHETKNADQYNRLLVALANENYQFILAYLPQTLDAFHKQDSDPENILNFVYRLMRDINMALLSDDAIMEEAKDITSRLLRSESSAELLSFLWKWYELINQNQDQDQQKELSLPIKQAIAYINENYTERITLQSVSEAVFLSSSYLSHLFFRESGIYFTDYLELVRIQGACYLLEKEDMLIRDISEAVGFSSQAYFSRSFKKMMGVSPAEYRRSHLMSSRDEGEGTFV